MSFDTLLLSMQCQCLDLLPANGMWQNMIEQPAKNNERTFHVWQCVKRREYIRPHGRQMTPACGKWNVKSSKYAKPSRAIQANCRWCERRPRLNPNELTVYTFPDREQAEDFAGKQNGGVA